ncbi:MAG TPA: YIP1 family protein [Anaeromyxobacter sp.]|nr:YIP1 family protein [Anaeromyxobacter sp.]
MLARCARCQGTFTTERFGRQTCPHCGSELLLADPGQPQPPPAAPPGEAAGGLPPPPPPGGGWAPPPPPTRPAEQPDLPSPFAERRTRGFFRSFFETWKLVATEPQKFFARVRIDQVGTAILFGVLASWVGGAVGGLLNTLSSRAQLAQARDQLSGAELPAEAARWLEWYLDRVADGTFAAGQAILAPIWALLWMFVLTAMVHVLLLVFQGARRGFSATLTVVAFSHGLYLISAVPQCGGLIAWVWQIVVMIAGIAAIHRTQIWKSATAVLAPLFICCCCFSTSTVMMIAAAVSQNAGGAGGVTDL